MISPEEYENAQQKVYQSEKQQLIDDFEKAGKERTNYSIEEHDNYSDFFYGIPVFKDGKLEGFNMMTFTKVYGDETVGFGGFHSSPDKEYKNENGNSFMSVDEYFEFYKEHEKKDGRLGALLRKVREHDEIEKSVLNNSKLGKLRNKLAKKIDNVLGTNLEEKKIAKPLKKIERSVSDKLFGKVKE